MKLRLQADASLKAAIVDGVRRREPSIDFRPAGGVLPEGVDDLTVLRLAAGEGRILVSHDVHTMPMHFANFVDQEGRSPGVFLIPQKISIAESIEEIVLIWSASDAQEWSGRLVWLPL
jgi:hypothetical protein